MEVVIEHWADRDKKSGVADIEILTWVGDVGDVVWWNTFFDRVGVFQRGLEISKFREGSVGNCNIFLHFIFRIIP